MYLFKDWDILCLRTEDVETIGVREQGEFGFVCFKNEQTQGSLALDRKLLQT